MQEHTTMETTEALEKVFALKTCSPIDPEEWKQKTFSELFS